jgi:hypothetical protein
MRRRLGALSRCDDPTIRARLDFVIVARVVACHFEFTRRCVRVHGADRMAEVVVLGHESHEFSQQLLVGPEIAGDLRVGFDRHADGSARRRRWKMWDRGRRRILPVPRRQRRGRRRHTFFGDGIEHEALRCAQFGRGMWMEKISRLIDVTRRRARAQHERTRHPHSSPHIPSPVQSSSAPRAVYGPCIAAGLTGAVGEPPSASSRREFR